MSKEIFFENEVEWEQVGEGISRQILGHDEKILMVKVKFDQGGIGAVHDHFHSQVTYVVSGKFELELEGKKTILKAGDSFYIPPNARHGAVCLASGELIDVFSPIREDFFGK